MGMMLSGLGLKGGYSSGDSTTTENASTSGSTSGATANTYSPDQTGVQSGLAGLFAKLLPGIASGQMSDNVTAMKTASADAINKTSSGLTDRVTRFLAQRGFGRSGSAGKATLQGELGRESNLAQNESNYAGVQLGQNNSTLMAALNYAFNALGGTYSGTSAGTSTSTTNSSGEGWGVGGSASFSPK